MAKNYNNPYIISKIINNNFTFTDLNPKLFPQLRHGAGLYCPFHASSHTGTQQARIYFNEEKNIFYLHCYVEGRNFYPSDYVWLIMCKEKQLFKSPKEFLLSKMSSDDFIAQYNLIESKQNVIMESQFKKKCEYIDNVYNSTGNIVSYIETLYTA